MATQANVHTHPLVKRALYLDAPFLNSVFKVGIELLLRLAICMRMCREGRMKCSATKEEAEVVSAESLSMAFLYSSYYNCEVFNPKDGNR